MKKTACILLAATLVFTLSGCGLLGFGKPGGSLVSNVPEITPHEWWTGDWYGYWEVDTAEGVFAEMEGGRWDCYATIGVSDDGPGHIILWEDWENLAELDITVEVTEHSLPMGIAQSVTGWFWGNDLAPGEWYIDPAVYGYENFIGFSGIYRYDASPEDQFSYSFYMRPWGQLWEDIPADKRPPDYDWYLQQYTGSMQEAEAKEYSFAFADLVMGEGRIYFSYNTDVFFEDDEAFIPTLIAYDYSVMLEFAPQDNPNALPEFLDYFATKKGHDGYAQIDTIIGGYDAVNVSYIDPELGYIEVVYIDFTSGYPAGTGLYYYGMQIVMFFADVHGSAYATDAWLTLESLLVIDNMR